MTDKEIEKWFSDNNMGWVSRWIGSYIDNEIWSIEPRVMDTLLESWESKTEPTMTERMQRSIKYVRHKKIEELGI